VTSVGATQLTLNPQPGCGQIIDHKRKSTTSCFGERVSSSATASAITSGGGFSSVYPRPSYQTDAVDGYLRSGIQLPNSTLFTAANRGYPDVTAIGAWLASANQGAFNPVFGSGEGRGGCCDVRCIADARWSQARPRPRRFWQGCSRGSTPSCARPAAMHLGS
jgi:hypothetical protein